ncbi:glycine cleavage system H protein [Limimaricola variabilis]|jgi:glycine cleavage system H protein|uniref:Glycine cleavage system H protein n=1 Tax=Limimaricola variabilis TaxID=1492771 RepID=A0ABR6HN34_9RHOB|nr:glycine cleavage system protein GcvH [Limimaricola variabilis]MBB3711966.1 glycine cleavage system H protein [Limimaricola variabilis]WPY96745.1 glycine cleavage system protein GcvH [Limimaricola variabilis]
MKYTQEHEWLRPEGDIVTVGITQHATTQLGDIVFVELPEVGATVSKGDEIVVIESVKAASEIMAPIDGEIVEVNEELAANPALANQDATGAGWFFKIRPSDPSQMDDCMDEAAYTALIG